MKYALRNRSARVLALALGLTITAMAGARAQTEVAEAEPNSACAAAQDLTQTALPLVASGSLQTPPGTPDVDFYRLAGTPGDFVRINVDGRFVYPLTLEGALLGVFDSSCGLIDTNEGYGPEPQLFVQVPADGVLLAAVTSSYDWDFSGDGADSGTYRLRVRREAVAEGITVRVNDARTGQPLPWVNVTLSRCRDEESCDTAGGAQTDESGEIRFATGLHTTEGPLLAGSYRINAYRPNWQPYESALLPVSEGEDVDFGTIALRPDPAVGSIRGRVADQATGAPVSGLAEPYARVQVQSCWDAESPWACWTMAYLPVEADGSFTFSGYPGSSGPAPGWFRVYAWAEQYKGTQSAAFHVGEDEHADAGTLALESFPVRIYLDQGCGEIPSTGGTCNAAVRVVNGSPARLQAEAWSIVQANKQDFGTTNLTTFQAGAPRSVSLAPNASATLPLTFTVPAGVADGTSICGQTVVAPRTNQFETYGSRYLFCLNKGVTGFSAVPEAQTQDTVQKLLGRPGRR